jgi:hypothetical protein
VQSPNGSAIRTYEHGGIYSGPSTVTLNDTVGLVGEVAFVNTDDRYISTFYGDAVIDSDRIFSSRDKMPLIVVADNAELTLTRGAHFTEEAGVEMRIAKKGTLISEGTTVIGGLLENEGWIINTGRFTSKLFNNKGEFTNEGTFINDETLVNEKGGRVLSSGQFTNKRSFDNKGELVNLGTAANEGTFINDYTFVNEKGGKLVNSGQFTNKRTFNNKGELVNLGTVTNDGTLVNEGKIDTINGKIVNNGFLDNTRGTIEGGKNIHNQGQGRVRSPYKDSDGGCDTGLGLAGLAAFIGAGLFGCSRRK